MVLCKGSNNVFAVAYSVGNATQIAVAALKAHTSRIDVDAVASKRLAPLAKIPSPAMSSNHTDLGRLNAKVFSVMRVNTLAAEGTCKTHWSTHPR